MGHHHREEITREPQITESGTISNHPFFETNDLTYLSIILPFLSEPGKQLISFFINFGNTKPEMPDPLSLLKQLAPKIENSPLKEILPTILNLLSNPDNKAALNPAILSSLLTKMSAKSDPLSQ